MSGVAAAFAPAKVNLTLHVIGQRADGYHLLDSLVVFADVGDHILVAPGSGLHLKVTGPMATGVPVDDSNLVIRAARTAGVTDAQITLDKHLPAAAGIGGGSSDAAATLRALMQSQEADGAVMPENVLALGADVPVCLAATATRMSGIGEVLEPIPGLPPFAAVLVNPGVGVSTPEVFRALRHKDGAPMGEIPAFSGFDSCVAWLAEQRNDLQAAAVAQQPVIGRVLDRLQERGAVLARMSGSGATCFGLFADTESAKQVAADLARVEPEWWIRPTVLG